MCGYYNTTCAFSSKARWYLLLNLKKSQNRLDVYFYLLDYVFVETNPSLPYQIRRIEELTKVGFVKGARHLNGLAILDYEVRSKSRFRLILFSQTDEQWSSRGQSTGILQEKRLLFYAWSTSWQASEWVNEPNMNAWYSSWVFLFIIHEEYCLGNVKSYIDCMLFLRIICSHFLVIQMHYYKKYDLMHMQYHMTE
jgi:hypothetical protein